VPQYLPAFERARLPDGGVPLNLAWAQRRLSFRRKPESGVVVIPAQAGIHSSNERRSMPAYAGIAST
jgi:hypothetical protein